jgi:hypothetical protein
MTNNNTASIVYSKIFVNFGYTTCFDPKESSSGVSTYTLFTYWLATSQHGPRRKHSLSIAEEACLLIRCLAIDVVLLLEYASAGIRLPSRCLPRVYTSRHGGRKETAARSV